MSPSNTPSTDSELASFMQRWSEAIVTNRIDQMSPFTTDDWVLVDTPGTISRDAFHEVVAHGALRHDSMHHDVLDIHRLGDVAIIRTHGRNSGRFGDEDIEADEWTTNILVRDGDGWRCILTQLTPRDSRG